MESKTDRIKTLLASGEERKALVIAARFFDRSDETKVYQQAASAMNNPGFYQQIGKDPDKMVGEAIGKLRSRFEGINGKTKA